MSVIYLWLYLFNYVYYVLIKKLVSEKYTDHIKIKLSERNPVKWQMKVEHIGWLWGEN